MWIRVCQLNDVPRGEVRGFRVSELAFPVLIANVGGRYFASSSICPHEDVSLLDGDLHGVVLTCPGHGYQFSLDSGRCAHDGSLRLRRFPVRVSGAEVEIDLALHRAA